MNNEVETADKIKQGYDLLCHEIGKVVIGQKKVIKSILTAIFSNGHVLLVGVPGLAKTLLVNTIAKSLSLSFKRIQFTPDLMPSDILGAETIDKERNFKFLKGPVFANIVLADEINRTPPKTQSSLLEAMQERSVTVAGNTYRLAPPFIVLATQNPIEQEGTYPLPEAQLDRFTMMINLDYPKFEDEIEIIKKTTSDQNLEVNPFLDSDQIIHYQNLILKVPVTDNVFEYTVNMVHKSRPGTSKGCEISNKYLDWGAGPRAGQFLIMAAKCNAILSGKYSPDIEDIQEVAPEILRHRLVRNFKAEADGVTIDEIIKQLF